jgi:hypothetical protein
MKALWEILVPTISNEGKPFRTRYHRVWDAKVRDITGGLTIIHPVKGQWVASNGELFKERMIPVRIACTRDEIEAIADFTAQYYGQIAVMFAKISDEVIIKHYPAPKIDQGAKIAKPPERRKKIFGC